MQVDILADSPMNWNAQGAELILQNVRNLLNTFTYEIAYMCTCGIPAGALDGPYQQSRSVLLSDVYDLIEQNEPRAKLVSFELLGLDDAGNMTFRAVVEI